VALTSETDATRGMTKLSGSRPRLKVCVATAIEKREIKRKLMRLETRAIITRNAMSELNPVTLPMRNATRPNRMCHVATAISTDTKSANVSLSALLKEAMGIAVTMASKLCSSQRRSVVASTCFRNNKDSSAVVPTERKPKAFGNAEIENP